MSRPISSESVFRAIADPTRRRIIELLRAGDQRPGDLARALRVRPPIASFHLRVLVTSGLVQQRRRGRERVYRAHPQALGPVLQWLRACEVRS